MWVAARDPRTPFHAKLVAIATAAYAFSPIDLIPDFIPVLGLLDDLLIVPLGVWLVWRLVPGALRQEYRMQAEKLRKKPVSWFAGSLVAMLWMVGLAGMIFLLAR